MIEQCNLFVTDRKRACESTTISKEEMLKSLFGDIDITTSRPKIQPIQQKDMQFRTGMYFRTKSGDVCEIGYMAKDGIIVRTRTKRNKQNQSYKVEEKEYYKIFYGIAYDDSEKTYYPYTQLNTLQTSNLIIDCIYPGDSINLRGYIKCKVLDRVTYKGRIILYCVDTDGMARCVYNEDIISKCNKPRRTIKARGISNGDAVKHWRYGWYEVVQVWHKKVMVKTKSGGTMMIQEWDIIDHRTREEQT